jgi:hypothetical protein
MLTTRTWTRLSIVAALSYNVLMAGLIFIRPEVDATHQPISEYAIGRLGWIMILAFMCSALSYGSLAAALRDRLQGRLGTLGYVLLVLCTIGTVGVGAFVADPVATPFDQLSTIGTLHVIFGSSALILLPFAALLINLSVARRYPAMRTPLLLTAGLPLLGFVVAGVLSSVVPPEGWPPRVLLLTYAVWLIVLAAQLLSIMGHKEVDA